MGIEIQIKRMATILGAIALIFPTFFLLLQSQRPQGKSSGVGKGSRRWPGVFLMTLGFVGLGVLLWEPLPVPISLLVGVILTIIGAFCYFPGILLYFWGITTLRYQYGVSGLLGAELYQNHVLITEGPYRYIRHPMYLGVLLTALGALFVFRTWAMVVFLPMSLVVTGRATREERLLEVEFGEEWRFYASQVPKWLPKLKSRSR